MRRFILPMAFASAVLVAGFSLARGRDAQLPPVKAAPVWEYRVLLLTDVVNLQQSMKEPEKIRLAIEEKYNELGRDGWEYGGSVNMIVTFKRMKP